MPTIYCLICRGELKFCLAIRRLRLYFPASAWRAVRCPRVSFRHGPSILTVIVIVSVQRRAFQYVLHIWEDVCTASCQLVRFGVWRKSQRTIHSGRNAHRFSPRAQSGLPRPTTDTLPPPPETPPYSSLLSSQTHLRFPGPAPRPSVQSPPPLYAHQTAGSHDVPRTRPAAPRSTTARPASSCLGSRLGRRVSSSGTGRRLGRRRRVRC